MVRTQIQLTEDQAETLKRIAAERHVSIAGLIRQAVDSIISAGGTTSVEEKRKRALNIVGKFSSGKRDISDRHDVFLEEAFRK